MALAERESSSPANGLAHRRGTMGVRSTGSMLASELARLPPLLRALRPLQWTKNGVIFAALVFDRKVFEPEPLLNTLFAVLVFICVSGAVYLINDLHDATSDRLHPLKRLRPIAAGQLSARTALSTAGLLIAVGVVGSWLIRMELTVVVLGYLALMIAYSLGLKRMAILDVFAIATGFVLRAVAGAVAIAVTISPWLLVCTMLLALFLGFAKRRQELTLLPDAAAHRANLQDYSVPLLDQLIGICAAATVMAYAFYTFDAVAVPDNHSMMLTVPIVTYAIFRYLMLVERRNHGGSPEAVLFTDRPLLGSIVAWGLGSIVILYLAS